MGCGGSTGWFYASIFSLHNGKSEDVGALATLSQHIFLMVLLVVIGFNLLVYLVDKFTLNVRI